MRPGRWPCIRTRVLKDGTILQAAPGVDIDAMLDEDGDLKKEIRETTQVELRLRPVTIKGGLQ